jgi:hypothetical protein
VTVSPDVVSTRRGWVTAHWALMEEDPAFTGNTLAWSLPKEVQPWSL